MKIALPCLPERLRPYKFLVLLIPLFMILNYRGDEKYVADRRIIGHWEGTGRFISSDMHEELGYLRFDLTINEDLSVEGSIGGTEILDSRLVRHFRVFEKDGNIIYCRLGGGSDAQNKRLRGRFNIQLYLTSPDKIGFTSFKLGSYDGMANLKRASTEEE